MQRYTRWISQVNEWATRHNISTESAISILFRDSPHNPNGPDLVTMKDLIWDEATEFADLYKDEVESLYNDAFPTS